MLDNYREHIFDGIVIETPGGERQFVDAPEVARTAERAVTLTIPADEVARRSAPPDSSGGAAGRDSSAAAANRGRAALTHSASFGTIRWREQRGETSWPTSRQSGTTAAA